MAVGELLSGRQLLTLHLCNKWCVTLDREGNNCKTWGSCRAAQTGKFKEKPCERCIELKEKEPLGYSTCSIRKTAPSSSHTQLPTHSPAVRSLAESLQMLSNKAILQQLRSNRLMENNFLLCAAPSAPHVSLPHTYTHFPPHPTLLLLLFLSLSLSLSLHNVPQKQFWKVFLRVLQSVELKHLALVLPVCFCARGREVPVHDNKGRTKGLALGAQTCTHKNTHWHVIPLTNTEQKMFRAARMTAHKVMRFASPNFHGRGNERATKGG